MHHNVIIQRSVMAPSDATHYDNYSETLHWYKKGVDQWLVWRELLGWEPSHIALWGGSPDPIKCLWTYDKEYSIWETFCKNGYIPDDGVSLEEVGFKFCPYCGKEIHHETSTSQD